MPGPTKLYPLRLKVSFREEEADAVRLKAELSGVSSAEIVRRAVRKYLELNPKRKTAPPRDFNGAIERAWQNYLDGRAAYYEHFKGRRPGAAPKLTPARRALIIRALETDEPERVEIMGRGVWLSDFHTDNGFTGPDHAFRPSNIERFCELVAEVQDERRH